MTIHQLLLHPVVVFRLPAPGMECRWGKPPLLFCEPLLLHFLWEATGEQWHKYMLFFVINVYRATVAVERSQCHFKHTTQDILDVSHPRYRYRHVQHRFQHLPDALLNTHLFRDVAKGADNAGLFPCCVKHRSDACLYEALCSIASPGKQSFATNMLTSQCASNRKILDWNQLSMQRISGVTFKNLSHPLLCILAVAQKILGGMISQHHLPLNIKPSIDVAITVTVVVR